MKKSLRKEAGLSETGMIASQPYNPDRSLSFPDTVVRELERLKDIGAIRPDIYSRAVDLARGQEKILNKIYNSGARNLERAVMFILKQAR